MALHFPHGRPQRPTAQDASPSGAFPPVARNRSTPPPPSRYHHWQQLRYRRLVSLREEQAGSAMQEKALPPVLSLQLLPVEISRPPGLVPPIERALDLAPPKERALVLPPRPERALQRVASASLSAPGRVYSRERVLRRHWKRQRLIIHRRRAARQERRVGLGLIASVAVPSMLALFVLTALAGVGLAFYAYAYPALADLASELPKDSLKVYDASGKLIYELANQGSQTTVALNQISLDAINATIAIEDKDFWQNEGVDFVAVVRAASDDLRSNHVVSGASTITQQLIKNALVGPQPTLDRKLREMILALGITRDYSKEQILTFYLNTIYYGEQSYGIDAAAHAYFGLNDLPGRTAASQLDLAQGALLAGLPRAPTTYDPLLSLSDALARQKEVLEQMIVAGYITSPEAARAEHEAAQPGFLHPGFPVNLAPHFDNYVLRELQGLMDSGQVPEDILSRSGLRVMTTLNLDLQDQMLASARNHIAQMAAAHHMSNAAVVMIDYHTGAVQVLIGGIQDNTSSSQFDVATQGYRQPGSSFKPFVYVTAFEKGWSPGTAISDTPLSVFVSEGEPIYSPVNYDLRFHGQMTLRHALQNSFNVPAVRVELFAGVKDSLATAQAMGISSYLGTPAPSMVLGGLSVHLFDETSAYGVFADGGVRMPPYTIQEITDNQGRVIYQHQNAGTQVLSPQLAGLMTNVLSDDKERQYEFGVCSPLMLYDGRPYDPKCQRGDTGVVRPAAAKTGTTGDFKDNWTVGYTNDYVIGVWAGNNDGSPMVNVSGVDGAAPIWHDSMLLAEHGHPVVPFVLPPGLVRATVHYPDGVTSTDWYLPGTIPAGGVIVGYS
ncbi:MAG TPA: transglycosylase domain-containing protein [Ktedonobacterales bacterium]